MTKAQEHVDDIPLACQHCIILGKVRNQEARIVIGVDIWKWIASALGGACVTFILLWMSWPAKAVTREEMTAYVQGSSPYIQDKSRVVTSLETLTIKVDQIENNQNRLEILIKEHIASGK